MHRRQNNTEDAQFISASVSRWRRADPHRSLLLVDARAHALE